MNTECSVCRWIIKGYNNIYGTYCPKCGSFVKPEGKPRFIIERENKMMELREEFLKKMELFNWNVIYIIKVVDMLIVICIIIVKKQRLQDF